MRVYLREVMHESVSARVHSRLIACIRACSCVRVYVYA